MPDEPIVKTTRKAPAKRARAKPAAPAAPTPQEKSNGMAPSGKASTPFKPADTLTPSAPQEKSNGSGFVAEVLTPHVARAMDAVMRVFTENEVALSPTTVDLVRAVLIREELERAYVVAEAERAEAHIEANLVEHVVGSVLESLGLAHVTIDISKPLLRNTPIVVEVTEDAVSYTLHTENNHVH